jgi:hypothetical protein
VLSFIDGWVPPNLDHFADETLAAARLLRRLHDATAGSELAGGQEVVCHITSPSMAAPPLSSTSTTPLRATGCATLLTPAGCGPSPPTTARPSPNRRDDCG